MKHFTRSDSSGPRRVAHGPHTRVLRTGGLLGLSVATVVLFGALCTGTLASGSTKALYPSGVADSSEPSGEAPPGPEAMPGYTESYVIDFPGQTVPAGWEVFTGIPGGDPGAHFGASHIVVAGGLLRLNTWRDKNWHDRWVTGGLCQCGVSQVYGAYFLRSRQTGTGPNEVQLLWPASNKWPPEIDFNETGSSDRRTSGTLHYGRNNTMIHANIHINMLKWHTWGVIWTARSVLYTVDGRVWSSSNESSLLGQVPMNLDMEQRTMCFKNVECPKKNVSMLVDWVAEYVTSSHSSVAPTTTTTASTSTTTSTTTTTTP